MGSKQSPERIPGRSRSRWLMLACVGLISFSVRFTASMVGGGFATNGIYDDGVYYTSAARFVMGDWPYRDYLLLHPPGMTVLLAPFAWLGTLVGDLSGYTAARVALMVCAGATSALVALLASRWGLAAGWIAGGTHALYCGSIYAGSTLFMEGPSSLLAVAAVLLLLPRGEAVHWSRVALGGALLGILPLLKVWNAPIAVLILLASGRKRFLTAAAGALAAFLALGLPFALQGQEAMWRMVVTDQLGRPRFDLSPLARVANLLGLATGGSSDVEVHGLAAVATLCWAAIAVGAVAVSLRARINWILPVLAVVTAALALTSALALRNYGEFLSPWLAIAVGVGLGHLLRIRRWRVVLAGVLAGWFGILAWGALHPVGKPLPVAWLRTSLQGTGCVVTDDPVVLVALDRLSPQLRSRCTEIWVDVSGRTYDYAADGHGDRTENPVWQRVIYDYLTSTDASVSCRRNTGLSKETLRMLAPAKVGRVDGCDVFRFTPHQG